MREPVHPDKVVFERLHTVDSNEYEAAMAIYGDSFPANERQPGNVIRERIKNGSSELFVGLMSKQVVFIAMLWPFQSSPFILLDYIATHAHFRGRKIATQFLQYWKPLLARTNRYFILEAEDPAVDPNREQRQQRVDFYRANGACQLSGVGFILPPLQQGPPTKMILMIFPRWHHDTIESSIVTRLIIRLNKELYDRDEKLARLNSSGYSDKTNIALV